MYVIISPCFTVSGSFECSYVAVYSSLPSLLYVPFINVSVFIFGVLSAISTSFPFLLIDVMNFLKLKSNSLSSVVIVSPAIFFPFSIFTTGWLSLSL